MCIAGGGHNHTVYATHHDIDEVRRDIDEVRRECERKIEALDTEWKIKQVNWHHSVLSLIQQLYSTTSGEYYIYTIPVLKVRRAPWCPIYFVCMCLYCLGVVYWAWVSFLPFLCN